MPPTPFKGLHRPGQEDRRPAPAREFNQHARGHGQSTLPEDYRKLIAAGYPTPEQFDRWKPLMWEYSEKVANVVAERDNACRNGTSPTALRNFFAHVRAVEAEFKAHGDFSKVQAGLLQLKKAAEYQLKRKESPITAAFADFIKLNSDKAMQNDTSFRAFVAHFESVVAFFPKK